MTVANIATDLELLTLTISHPMTGPDGDEHRGWWHMAVGQMDALL